MMYGKDDHIEGFDEVIFNALLREEFRLEKNINLIASENYCSPRVIEALGTVLTNKYAEGYPGKRYYGGCEFVDEIEQVAINRAKTLFGADYANVQPHSGSQANASVYQALLKPGETLLGMRLAHGGHLTHGATVSASGKTYHAVQYGLNKEGYIDYDEIERLAIEHKPRVIVAGFSAYSRLLDFARFRRIADSVGAWLMVDMAHVAGLVATGHYPSPFPYADVVTSTTHKTLRGPRGGLILAGPNVELHRMLNSAVFPGIQGGPHMNVIAAKAVCFLEAMQSSFKSYQQQVIDNAQIMANAFIERGYDVISNGTSNHLLLISLANKTLTGMAAETLLARINITVNKNSVPGDPQPPTVTSGIRIGTPAVTTRGLGIDDCELLAHLICDVLDRPSSIAAEQQACHLISQISAKHPVYIRN